MAALTCPSCGSDSLRATFIGAVGARGPFDPTPKGSPGFACTACGDRFIENNGDLVKAGPVAETEEGA